MLFSMHDFGICKKVDLGKQTNGAGKIFMRSEHDAIETSKYANPIRDPLTVFFCPNIQRFFLEDGFHRLFECARRGYTGKVPVKITTSEDCDNDIKIQCISAKQTSWYDEIL